MPTVLVGHGSARGRRTMRSALEHAGYAVREAGDGPALLRSVHDDPPDLVVLDATLCRGGDVHELVGAIKRDPDLFRTAVVVSGAAVRLDAALDGLASGVHDYVTDHRDAAQLASASRSALRVRDLQDELLTRQTQLEELAFTDALTGCRNRRSILRQLDVMRSSAGRHGRPLSLLLADLDRFKAVNDRFGHAAGDTVLVEVADRLRERLRTGDELGRIGGEEFVVLLPETGVDGAGALAESLRRAVAEGPVPTRAGELPITMSVGYAQWQGESAEMLLARADIALYAAKRAGRDRVAPYAQAYLGA